MGVQIHVREEQHAREVVFPLQDVAWVQMDVPHDDPSWLQVCGTFSDNSLGDQSKGAHLDVYMLCSLGQNSREQHALESTSFKLLLFCERLGSFLFCTFLTRLQGAQTCRLYRVSFFELVC